MKLNNKHISLILSLCALTACSEQDVIKDEPIVPDADKTPIELKVGDNAPSTRAAFVDGKGKITAFEKDTRLHFLMISHDKNNDNAETSTDMYTETYGTAVGSGKSVSLMDAGSESEILFTDNKGIPRYWDDAHARDSKLSIYAFANVWTGDAAGAPWYPRLDRTTAPNGAETGKETNSFTPAWVSNPNSAIGTIIGGSYDATYNPKGKWIVGDFTAGSNNKYYKEQTMTSILEKDDICYSNNIADYSTSSTDTEKDKRLFFNTTDKHFTSGTLEFHRAMSMFTINVYMGPGFSESDFKFKEGTNIAMKGFNKKGYLNIKKGEWTASSIEEGTDASYEGATGYSWSKIDCTNDDQTNPAMYTDANGNKYYTLLAFVIPGTDIKNSAVTDALTFIINDNLYKVSMATLYQALYDNKANWNSTLTSLQESDVFDLNSQTTSEYTCLKAGINYEFNLTVGKTAIDKITASIVDWKTVKASANPDNALPLTITMETSAGNSSEELPAASRLFKSSTTTADLSGVEKGYSNTSGQYFDLLKGNGVQNTGWYWPSNSTYYHFRTVSPIQELTKDGDSESNYLTMTGGEINNAATGNDYIWGAPLQETHSGTDSHVINYDAEKGYNHSDYLYPAIGPTKSTIHITQFHMMTDLEINLSTTTDDAAVALTSATASATVVLKNYANTANLMIGNGLVTEWGNIIPSKAITEVTKGQKYSWRVVPQPLKRTGTNAGTVGIEITTVDGNVYKITDLSTLLVTKEGESTPTTIPTWEPGTKYVYNLVLSKSKIESITATVVDWKTVTTTTSQPVVIQ